MSRRVATLVSLLWISAVSTVDGSCVTGTEAECCTLSTKLPSQGSNKQLKFCSMYPEETCCVPAQDAEIEEHFFNLLDAGDVCDKEASKAKDGLRSIFCFGCNPVSIDYEDRDLGVIKICNKIASDIKPEYFDECGMVRVEERGDLCSGDDVVIPSRYWPTCAEGEVSNSNLAVQGFPEQEEDSCLPVVGGSVTVDGAVLNGVKGCLINGTLPSTGSYTNTDAFSCHGYWKILNDNAGAKPPFMEDFVVAIVDCVNEDCGADVQCYTGSAVTRQMSAITVFISTMLFFMIF